MDIGQYIDKFESIADIIPNYFTVIDPNHYVVFANKNSRNAIGFKPKQTLGTIRYCDFPCEASKEAEIFIYTDKLVFKHKKSIKSISLFQFATGWRLSLTSKDPLFDVDTEKLIGVTFNAIDITNLNLVDLGRFIPELTVGRTITDRKKFHYILDGWDDKYHLSDRLVECLFYMIRGKTCKEIAKLLNLSPRTVETYINDIKLRMHCSSKSQVIEKAIIEGFSTILPRKVLWLLDKL